MENATIVPARPGFSVVKNPELTARACDSWRELIEMDPRREADPVVAWAIIFTKSGSDAYCSQSIPIMTSPAAERISFHEVDDWALIYPDGQIRCGSDITYLSWEDFVTDAFDHLREYFEAKEKSVAAAAAASLTSPQP